MQRWSQTSQSRHLNIQEYQPDNSSNQCPTVMLQIFQCWFISAPGAPDWMICGNQSQFIWIRIRIQTNSLIYFLSDCTQSSLVIFRHDILQIIRKWNRSVMFGKTCKPPAALVSFFYFLHIQLLFYYSLDWIRRQPPFCSRKSLSGRHVENKTEDPIRENKDGCVN